MPPQNERRRFFRNLQISQLQEKHSLEDELSRLRTENLTPFQNTNKFGYAFLHIEQLDLSTSGPVKPMAD